MTRSFLQLNSEELGLLRESAARLFAAGGTADAAAALGLADFCKADAAGLAAAIAVAAEAGRARNSFPVHLAVAANLSRRDSDDSPSGESDIPAFAQANLMGEDGGGVVADGSNLTGRLRFVEGLPSRSLLIATESGFALVDSAHPGVSATATPCLRGLPFADIELEHVPSEPLEIGHEARDDALLALQLLVVARAHGAARRAFELAVGHVTVREQFGQPLGRFQAMQHKLADCEVMLSATGALVATAAGMFDTAAADRRWFLLAAIAFGTDVLRRAIFEIQHAFGAVGYAEEHEASAHFRLVQSELVRFGGARHARRRLIEELYRRGGLVPAVNLGDDVEAYRAMLRDWLESELNDDVRAAEAAKPFADRGWNGDFAAAMGRDGLIGIAWPKSSGGAGRSPLEQLAFVEEFNRADAPMTSQSAASWIAGPEIIRHGSPRLKAELLPAILDGSATFCLGYSEPEAGSDLASLRTRAVRDGETYRITGQKLWGTGTEKATHVLLAARTGGDDLPKHRGISLFVVPLSSAGITISPDLALYGHYFCTQFYDDVVVPAEFRLGDENGGWNILAGALASERILMGGTVARQRALFEAFFAYLDEKEMLAGDAVLVDRLGTFAAEIEAARQLSLVPVREVERGGLPLVEGAAAKLFTGDLGERFAAFAIDALGTAATLCEGGDAVPLAGKLEQELRRSPMGVIGGGAAEVQKTIIAQRGLGLPR